MKTVIKLDGHYYAVQTDSYTRKWERQFNQQLVSQIVELNWVDKGPGVRVYQAILILQDWSHDSLPYKQGVTETFDQQRKNLETSYTKIATAIEFEDPFSESPTLGGVYFTSYIQTIPSFASNQKPYILAPIIITEGKVAISA